MGGSSVRAMAIIEKADQTSQFIKDVLDGKVKDGKASIEIPERANRLAEKKLGHKIKTHSISANEVRHINKNHGTKGKKNTENSIPLRNEDIALLPYIMAAPDRVEKGSTKADGTESIRYYKNLGNGYIVVVEQEGRFDVGEMEAITMWAERTDNKKSHPTNVSDARKNRPLNSTSQPVPTSTTETGTVIISPNDTAKIKQDFENAVKNDAKNDPLRFAIEYSRSSFHRAFDSHLEEMIENEEAAVSIVNRFFANLTETNPDSRAGYSSKYRYTGQKINGKHVVIRTSNHIHSPRNVDDDVYLISVVVSNDEKRNFIDEEYTQIWIKDDLKNIDEALYDAVEVINEIEYTLADTRFLSTPSGEVLGFVADGKIYLDSSKLNPETIAEEFTHLQQQALRLAAEQGNREARKIIRAWDEATKSLVNAFIGNRTSRATRDLLKAMGISENDMASEVYKKQPNESDEAYKTRLQDELWAKAQKKAFAEHLEKLANRNNLTAAGMKMYEALKDFAIYLGKQLGIYNQKEWSKLTLPELIDRTNKALSSDRFLRDTEHIRFQQRNQPTFKPISKRQFNQLARGLSRAFKKAGKNTKVHVGAKKMADRLNQLSKRGYNTPRMQTDYKMDHTAPNADDSPLHDLTTVYGDDIYSDKAHYYFGDGNRSMDKKSASILQRLKGKPKAKVTVYRAVPKGVTEINSGDWVSINRDYAVEHGERHLDGEYDIISKELTADQVFTDGNSMHEQGVQFLQTKDGTIYGFVDPVTGDIYIDGDLMNANTPIHEFGHLWISNVQQTNPKLWERMVSLAKQTPEWKRLANDPNYKQGQFKGKKGKALDNAIADEVWATIIGNHGENNFEAILEKMNGDRTLAQKVWDAVQDFWQSVVDFFHDAGVFSGEVTLPNIGRSQIIREQGTMMQSTDQSSEVTAIADMALGQMMSGEFGTSDPVMDFAMQYASESELLRDANGNVIGVKPEVLEEIRKEREQIEQEAQANGTWLKAPNGKKSNLTDEQWVTVRTKRFKDWFGDWQNDPENASKVVDENGEPLVVYHGTPDGGFTEFSEIKKGTRTGHDASDVGFHFTNDIDYASTYSLEYLKDNYQNLIDIFGYVPDASKAPENATTYSVYLKIVSPKTLPDAKIDKNIIDNAKKGKNDGLFASLGKTKEYVVFHPNQIKSATDNVGTYSEQSNDIRFSIRSNETPKPIPVNVAKEAISIMKEVAGFTNNSRTIFDAGIDFIKTTEWYENLSPEQQAQVDTPTFRNAVGQMIKSLNASNRKINELKTMRSFLFIYT